MQTRRQIRLYERQGQQENMMEQEQEMKGKRITRSKLMLRGKKVGKSTIIDIFCRVQVNMRNTGAICKANTIHITV
ncbi:hypothetical protein ACN9MH_24505 [Paenibacillus silvae]|uniref:hypothetical protein n=1 Tax=Paenibacillus TaxID=44249 RepID=UPI0020A018A0|nr:hypothetical protein [Paenibacillus barcinonensis]